MMENLLGCLLMMIIVELSSQQRSDDRLALDGRREAEDKEERRDEKDAFLAGKTALPLLIRSMLKTESTELSDLPQWSRLPISQNINQESKTPIISSENNNLVANSNSLDDLMVVKKRLQKRRGKLSRRKKKAKRLKGASEAHSFDSWSDYLVEHPIRHSRRKIYDRHHKGTLSNGGVHDMEKDLESQVSFPSVRTNTSIDLCRYTKCHLPISESLDGQLENQTNVIFGENMTRSKAQDDIFMEDGNQMSAAEMKDVLLLAIPLSLFFTVILFMCITFCCLRHMGQHAFNNHTSYEGIEEEDFTDDLQSKGLCEACLPEISSQEDMLHKIKLPKKKRSHEQRKSTEEEEERMMEGESQEDSIKYYHTPLYTLLSNLPPGSTYYEGEDYKAFESLGHFRPRRSQSLEFLVL